MKQSAREKNETKKWRFLLGILTAILAAGGILCGTGVLAAPVFPSGATVQGISVSEQSVQQASETLQKAAEEYKLTVHFAQSNRTFSAKELGLTVDQDAVERLAKATQQDASTTSAGEDTQTVFTCETDLKQEMQTLPERTAHADKATQDAVLTYDKKAGKYVIREEQVGGTIDTQALAEAVQTAAEQLQPELDAVGQGLYGGESVRRSDDEKLNQALEQANRMLQTDVTYTFEVERKNVYGKERLNKSTIQKWLTVSQDGKRIQISEEKVYASGIPIGIYIKTEGILVLGLQQIDGKNSPASCKIKEGDYILKLNAQNITTKQQFIRLLQKNGEEETKKFIEIL